MRISNIVNLFQKEKPVLKPLTTKDIIEEATLVTAELMDMDYCLTSVNSSLEIYDEILEAYHYTLWEKPDNSLLCTAFFELRQTADSLNKLHSDLVYRCFEAWNKVLKSPDAQKHFWGRESQIKSKDLEQVFSIVFSTMIAMEYDSTPETSVNSFKIELLKCLERDI
ncbi:MAG: hypothetical protein GX154_05965 [Clostridiales bacterium]|nr:hypothetical protein [Clostridiales bacterium]